MIKIKVIEVGNNIEDVTVAAISSFLLESSIEKARKITFDVCGNSSLSLQEVNSTTQIIYQRTNLDAEIHFRATIDEKLHGEFKVTIIATNFTA